MFPLTEFLRFLAGSSLAISVLLLFTWLVGKWTEKASAAFRHALWLTCFGGILLVLIGFLVPSRPQLNLLSEPELLISRPAPPPNIPSVQGSAQTFKHNRTVNSGRNLVLLGWILGFTLCLARFLHGLYNVSNMVRNACPATPVQLEMMQCIADAFDLKKAVSLVLVDQPITPMTWGWFKTRMLLPADAIDWSEERLELVLGHELAHVARRDFHVLLLVQLLCAFYWFNPLIWVARRHLVREREKACDDMVLKRGAVPSNYADHLLAIASGRPACGGAAGLCMSRISELEGRLLAILAPGSRRSTLSGSDWSRLGTLFVTLALPLATFSPWEQMEFTINPTRQVKLLDEKEIEELKRQGIDDAYVTSLHRAGYRDLTMKQILGLHKVMPEHASLEEVLRTGLQPLSPVADRSHICMRANQVIEHKVVKVEIEGLHYYAMASCSRMLLSFPSTRFSVDPYSGNAVSKATAIPAATADGVFVYYFENTRNLERYNEMIATAR